jgi:hypothetical protein
MERKLLDGVDGRVADAGWFLTAVAGGGAAQRRSEQKRNATKQLLKVPTRS